MEKKFDNISADYKESMLYADENATNDSLAQSDGKNVYNDVNKSIECKANEEISDDKCIEANDKVTYSEEIKVPQFERQDWKDKVIKFGKKYSVAESLGKEIGQYILENDTLWNDEHCLEKALLEVLSSKYMTDENKAKDSSFLEKYIFNNEAIKARIIDDYLNTIDSKRMPSTIDKDGHISLTLPHRPKNIAEAGRLAERMLRR